MKKTRIVDSGKGVKFKIEEDDGETLESLAIELAEALSAKSYYEKQSSTFRLHSQSERKKATERNTLIFQLKEYNKEKNKKGENNKISRMEPMESYDSKMLEEERQECLRRANDFHEKADKFDDLVSKENKKINIIKTKMSKARNGTKK